MASITLGVGDTFPDGTTVGAYPASAWSDRFASGAPLGAATESKAVSNATLSYTALLPDTGYYAAASVSGTYRYIYFKTAATERGVELGYAEITANVTQTGVGNQDVAGLSVTVTVGSRPINVVFNCYGVQNSADLGMSQVNIKESSTTLAYTTFTGLKAGTSTGLHRVARLAPTAGQHTYKINLQQVLSGNSVLQASATSPAYIQVVEI